MLAGVVLSIGGLTLVLLPGGRRVSSILFAVETAGNALIPALNGRAVGEFSTRAIPPTIIVRALVVLVTAQLTHRAAKTGSQR
jgi:hypothetical protein